MDCSCCLQMTAQESFFSVFNRRSRRFFFFITARNRLLPLFFLYFFILNMPGDSIIQVRSVTVDDEKHTTEVCEMINEAFRSSESWTRDSHIVGAERISHDGVKELIDNNGKPDTFMLAFDSNKVVGCIVIREDGLLSMLSVSPKYQSRGIGGLLMRESIAHMKNVLQKKMAIVHVFQSRPELLIWYQRLGFVDYGEVIPFPIKEILLVDEAPLVVLKMNL